MLGGEYVDKIKEHRCDSLSQNALTLGLTAPVSTFSPWESLPVFLILLPTRSEEREVLDVGIIPVAILPSCQDMKPIAL